MVQPDRPQMAIWGMRFASWISKATDTLSEYVTLIFHSNNNFTKAPQCYVVGTLHVLLHQLKTILYSGAFVY
jgi:hypothetical protein